MKKKSQSKGVKYWKKKAWEVFSKYIRLRDALATTKTKETLLCYTCRKPYPVFGVGCAQAGHFIPGRGNSILFDERGTHGQCYMCNCTLKGNWPEYLKRMELEYGHTVVQELLELKNQVKKYTVPELQELIEIYKKKMEELK